MTFNRKASVLEKLGTSVINAVLALLISLPLAFIYRFGSVWKISTIVIFFISSVVFMLFNKNRDLGMIVFKTYWEKEYSLKQQIAYNLLYCLSFSTLFFSVFFPFDLFIANMLTQILFVKLTGTTLHGYLSGRMVTIRRA